MVTFCIIHIGNRKIFLIHHSPPPPPPPRVPTNPFARVFVHILHNTCEKLVGTRGGGGMISHNPKCDVWASLNISIWIFGVLS